MLDFAIEKMFSFQAAKYGLQLNVWCMSNLIVESIGLLAKLSNQIGV